MIYTLKSIPKYSKPVSVFGILFSIILIPIPGIGIIAELYFWTLILGCYIMYLCSHNWCWCIYSKYNSIIIPLLFWMLIRSQNLYGFKNFCLFAFLMLIFVTKLPYRNISKLNLLLLYCIIVVMAITLKLTGNFYTNTNIGAVITAIVTVLAYIYFIKYRITILIIGIPSIIVFEARSVILALGLAVIMIFLVKRDVIKLKTLLIMLTSIIIIIISILWDFLMSPEFNSLVLESTNKNFQSGRIEIWTMIFEYMKGIDWLIGVGGGVRHGDIVPGEYSNLSLHSTYVFMLFHYGCIGLSLLILLFYKTLKRLIDKGYFYSSTLFLFFILRDFFEITLINNQMAIAVLFWGWIANGWVERNNNKSCKHLTSSTGFHI